MERESCDGIVTRAPTAIIIVTSLDVQIVWYMYTEFRRLLVALHFTQDVMCVRCKPASKRIDLASDEMQSPPRLFRCPSRRRAKL